jgi:hypothetical protein
MDLRVVGHRKLLLTVSRRPPERIELIERAMEGFSATQRTRILQMRITQEERVAGKQGLVQLATDGNRD